MNENGHVHTKRRQGGRGQSLVEFALIVPILAFLLMGIVDFGRAMFTYAQASNALRGALRQSSILGDVSGSPNYLNCDQMMTTAENVMFGYHYAFVEYVKDSNGVTIACPSTGSVTDDQLENGDMLVIRVESTLDLVTPLINNIWPSLSFTLSGQRTIIKDISLQEAGGGSGGAALTDTLSVSMDTELGSYQEGTDTALLEIVVADENGIVVTGLTESAFSWPTLPSGTSIVSGSFTELGNGMYTFELDISSLSQGTDYVITVEVDDGDASNFDSAVFAITLAPTPPFIYLSDQKGGRVGKLKFKDEDVLIYDLSEFEYTLWVDGSDIGFKKDDIEALAVLADDSMLFVPGRGGKKLKLDGLDTVETRDIVRFTPSKIGSKTDGSFQLYFDGSDVGIDSGVGIDALSVLDDGTLVMSFTTNTTVTGIATSDEDLLAFTPIQLEYEGTPDLTLGTWDMFFDGSDVSLGETSRENVNGTWVDPETGDIYLTTYGTFGVSGAAGVASDIFVCESPTTGSNTSCTFNGLFFDGMANGYKGKALDAIHVVPTGGGSGDTLDVTLTIDPSGYEEGTSSLTIDIHVEEEDEEEVEGLAEGAFSWPTLPGGLTSGDISNFTELGDGDYTFDLDISSLGVGTGYLVEVSVDDGDATDNASGAFDIFSGGGDWLGVTLTIDPDSYTEGTASLTIDIHVNEEGPANKTGLPESAFSWLTLPTGLDSSHISNFTEVGSGDYTFDLDISSLGVGTSYLVGVSVDDGAATDSAADTFDITAGISAPVLTFDGAKCGCCYNKSQVNLSWTDVGATTYTLYRNGATDGTLYSGSGLSCSGKSGDNACDDLFKRNQGTFSYHISADGVDSNVVMVNSHKSVCDEI